MRIRLIAVMFLLVIPFTAFSGEKEKLAMEIIEMTDVKRVMIQVERQIEMLERSVLQNAKIPENNMKKQLELHKKIRALTFKRLGWDVLKNDFVKVFTKVYTLEELKGMRDFYKTPLGQSMLKKGPKVMETTMKSLQKRLISIIPEIQKLSKEMQKKE